VSSDIVIRTVKVTKKFGKFSALKNVNLTLLAKQQYVIRGHSGSGKSTLLYLLGGMDRPTSGEVWFKDYDLQSFDDDKLANYRNRELGFVFQFHYLLSSMNCIDNILLPARVGEQYSDSVKKYVKDLAETLGVTNCLKKFPYEISGGEQQRISILRALSLKPKLLLCDEPTGNLDSDNTVKVTKMLKDLSIKTGATLVIVTHEEDVSSQFENQITMKDGCIL
jgi:ABC-type lipoprotein export system ATPase subunit